MARNTNNWILDWNDNETLGEGKNKRKKLRKGLLKRLGIETVLRLKKSLPGCEIVDATIESRGLEGIKGDQQVELVIRTYSKPSVRGVKTVSIDYQVVIGRGSYRHYEVLPLKIWVDFDKDEISEILNNSKNKVIREMLRKKGSARKYIERKTGKPMEDLLFEYIQSISENKDTPTEIEKFALKDTRIGRTIEQALQHVHKIAEDIRLSGIYKSNCSIEKFKERIKPLIIDIWGEAFAE